MFYIEWSLSVDEKIQHRFALHRIVFVGPWMFVGLGIGLFFVTIFLAVPILALGVWGLFNYKCEEYGVTNKRVIHKTGIIGRKTSEMKISAIETVEMSQGAQQRIFGYGTVTVTGRGISKVVLENIDNPMDVKRSIESVSNSEE